MRNTNLHTYLQGALYYFAAKCALIESVEREQITFGQLLTFEAALKALDQLVSIEYYEGPDKNKIIEQDMLIKEKIKTLYTVIKEGHAQIMRLHYAPYFDEKDIVLINTVLNIVYDILMFWADTASLERIDEIVSNLPYKVEKISIGIK